MARQTGHLGAPIAMSKNKAEGSGEDRLIARYFKPIATHQGAFRLEDDAAAIAPPEGCDLVLTADGLVAGVHFFPDDPPDTVAKKALRANLSDLAAKGARPLGFLLTLALAEGDRRRLARAVRARLGRGRGSLRLPAARRRHCSHAGADCDLGFRIRRCAARQDGATRRSSRRGARSGDRHNRRRSARDSACGALRTWRNVGGSRATSKITSRPAIWCHSRATPLRSSWRHMLGRHGCLRWPCW